MNATALDAISGLDDSPLGEPGHGQTGERTGVLRTHDPPHIPERRARAALRGVLAPAAAMKRSPFGISQYELAPRLKPVDRICQRWAVGEGSGFPDADYDIPLKSRPTQLDDETHIIVAQIINKRIAPVSRRMIVKWYRTDTPVSAIADQMVEHWHGKKRRRMTNWRGRVVEELKESLQMTENGVILCWNLTLDELRIRFEESKHGELLRLLACRY